MPDETDMPKESKTDKFNIGPGEEHFQKFRIGDTEEELKRARGPGWRSEMPEIQMQLTPEEIISEILQREGEGYREQDAYWFTNRNFRRIIGGLEALHSESEAELEASGTHASKIEELQEKEEEAADDEDRRRIGQRIAKLQEERAKEKEKREEQAKEIRENLPVYYERLMVNWFVGVDGELNKQYLQFRNPIPYDVREEDQNVETIEKAVKIALYEEEWAETPEAKFWLYMIDRGRLWVNAKRDVEKGQAGGLDKFYDWKKVLSQVHERFRIDPPTVSYEIAYSETLRAPELPELEEPLTDEAKERIAGREKAIRYSAEARFWSMAVASVTQGEFDKDGNFVNYVGGEPIVSPLITEKERVFIQLLFGLNEEGGWIDYDDTGWVEYEGRKFPQKMLNWYSMKSTDANKERYIATMSYLLTEDIRTKFEGPEYMVEEPSQKDAALQNLRELALKIKQNVEERRKEWFTPEIEEDRLLADIVIKSQVVEDFGHKAVVHLGWGFDYKVEDGEAKREQDIGSTIVALDNGGFLWRDYFKTNQGKGWSRSLVPEMDQEYMDFLDTQSPLYKPDLKDMKEIYPDINLTEEELDSNELATSHFQELKQNIFNIDPEHPEVGEAMWKYYQSLVWYWATRYKDRDGNRIIIPMWTPPAIEAINFWMTQAWDPREKIKDKIEDGIITPGGETVWEALQKGGDLSKKEWSSVDASQMTDMAYYVNLVTAGQTVRILEVMNSKPELIGDQLKAFFEYSSMLAELEKRGDLWDREDQIPFPMINATLISQFIVATTGTIKSDIISEDGGNRETLGWWVASDLTEWALMIEDNIPGDRDGVENYKKCMLAFLDYWYLEYVRMSYGASKELSKQGETEGIVQTGRERAVNKKFVILAKEHGYDVKKQDPKAKPESRL